MNRILPIALLLSVAAIGSAVAQQRPSTAKDIVLENVSMPMRTTAAPAVRGDALVVSVLLESPDGSLTPKSTDTGFFTGDRFRVKVLASRDGAIALYNTKPDGVLNPEPVWRGEVKVNQETVSLRLVLDGVSGGGVDQLHVVLEPASTPNVPSWLTSWMDVFKSSPKDIRLDRQSTPSATYLLADAGKGLVTTVRIQHR